MTIPQTVAEILRHHVTLEVECIDRMYLNVYVADLQHEQGVACFLRYHRGHPVASSALLDPISKAFIANIEAFVRRNDVALLSFATGERKDVPWPGYRQRAQGRAPGAPRTRRHGQGPRRRHRLRG